MPEKRTTILAGFKASSLFRLPDQAAGDIIWLRD